MFNRKQKHSNKIILKRNVDKRKPQRPIIKLVSHKNVLYI